MPGTNLRPNNVLGTQLKHKCFTRYPTEESRTTLFFKLLNGLFVATTIIVLLDQVLDTSFVVKYIQK